MRLFILSLYLIVSLNSFSQYSNYYNIYKTVDVNQKVFVSGNINTIDYGTLALANAQREKNRLENQKYADERAKDIALSIANNPMLAFDYGTQIDYVSKRDKENNFIKFTYHCRIPHPSLFTDMNGGKFENVSEDGVRTEIEIFTPFYNKDKFEFNVEEYQKYTDLIVGQMNKVKNESFFLHKKIIERASVFGISGFKGTVIFEDDYEFIITDNYQSYSTEGILYNVSIRYRGSKNEINFEKLEGRRYYLRRLIEKIISTASITDYKVDK